MSYHYDFTWVAFDVYFWTMLEFGLGIMCACAPSLRVFIKRYIGEPLSSARSGNGGSGLQWTGKRLERTESQSQLTGSRGATESYTSAIVAKTTVHVSSGEKKAEEHEMRTRPNPFDLNESDKSMFAMATMTDSVFDPSAGSHSPSTSGPRSPKEYELEALASLHQSRKSLSQAAARRRPSEAGYPTRF